jgi:Holliday junction resolvasome RuvABC endonuclease subunit
VGVDRVKNILALDLGTNTGFAIYSGKIKSGVKNFKATRFQSADRRFVNFRKELEIIQKSLMLGIGIVYFEEVRRHIGVDAAHCYGGFKAILTTFCEDNEIPYQGVPVGTIKKHITGKGNADKLAVIKAVQALGFNPKDDNEADALALLSFAMKQESI